MPSTTAAISLQKVGFLFCSSHLYATIFSIKSPITSMFSDPPAGRGEARGMCRGSAICWGRDFTFYAFPEEK